jgi:hypothetical protein
LSNSTDHWTFGDGDGVRLLLDEQFEVQHSKTRSKQTTALMISTRAFAGLVSGA